MQKPPIKDYSINDIADGGNKALETPQTGNFFYVTESTHSRFAVQINDGEIFTGKLVRGHSFPVGFQIEKVRIYNRDGTGLPLNITFQVGEGTPINHLFNVSQDEIVPILRSDTPSIIGEAKATAGTETAVDTWFKLLDADEFRSEVWLCTDAAAGAAFWNTANPGAPGELFSRDIAATAEPGAAGFLKLKTTAAIWVRIKTAAKTVRALTFKFAA